MKQKSKINETIENDVLILNKKFVYAGLKINELQNVSLHKSNNKNKRFNKTHVRAIVILVIISVLYEFNIIEPILNYALGVRCIIPNNYFVWEATRPISDCQFCLHVSEPIILHNASRDEFQPYAYSSKPIVIKQAFLHWPAIKRFDFNFFKNIYNTIKDAYKSVDEECQFLHFRSNFISLRDVFIMNKARINNEPGQKPWYVGWGNCHPEVLKEMRKHYPKPHFLPEDCEIPSKEYVFMGYDAGATMHLDFINRLMWQAQLKGSKTWYLKPSPECEDICQPLSFLVEPGDAVLVDTRVWYHGTTITPGDFSLSIQSEYG